MTFIRSAALVLAVAVVALSGASALAQGRRRAPPPPAAPSPQAAAPEWIANPVAVFVGLNKITGRATDFEAKIGQTVHYGALEVTPRVCDTKPATERQQTAAFVQVDEITLQKTTKRIFSGWMFAASPGLNALEQPIFDVWLKDCQGGRRPEPPAQPQLGQ
ncbi:MAG TPA: DUF2155 domain-containing protein [Hyphomicrobiales bacterium]|nr:DUF2155 domain-containing protein [Hyphomicrobiales bacterium]